MWKCGQREETPALVMEQISLVGAAVGLCLGSSVGQGRGFVLSSPSQLSPALHPFHRLQTGWSVHTFQTEKQRKMQALSPKELEVILGVIRKAEKLDVVEQQRIGYSHVPRPLPSPGKVSTGRSGSPSCLSSASTTQSIP